MNKKTEEISEDKSQTKESAVNNECKNSMNDGVRNAANAPVSSLETIMEMFKGLQITPLSEINGISRSNHQSNHLFVDKRSHEKPSKISTGQEEYIKWDGNDVKVVAESGDAVKSHNRLTDNQKAKENLNSLSSTSLSLATTNEIPLLGSTDNALEVATTNQMPLLGSTDNALEVATTNQMPLLGSTDNALEVATTNQMPLLGSTDNALEASEVLEDRKNTSSTKSFTAPDIYNFTATPFSPNKLKSNRFNIPTVRSNTGITLSTTVQLTETSKSAPVFIFGDRNMQANTTTPASQMLSRRPKITSSKSHATTKTQNTKGGPTTSSNSPAESSEVKTCISTLSTGQYATGTLTFENTGIFNKTALMAMFDGTRKLFATSIVQIPESTDLKLRKSQVSFPFRNKFAACAKLSSKKSLCSQKKIWKNSESIASIQFKTVLPTFHSARKNGMSIYIFGSQDIPGTIFDQVSTSTSEKTESNGPVFDKSAWMSVLDSAQNIFVTSTDTKSLAQVQLTRFTNTFHKNKIDLFKYEDYKSALTMFEDAIQLCPDNETLCGIRAHYYMKLGKYKEAVTDIQKVISSDASFTDGYICLAKCYIALGYTCAADDAISRIRISDAEGARAVDALRAMRVQYDDTQRAVAAQDYARAVTCVDRFLELCPSNTAKATKAKYLAMLGETEKALKLAEECLHYHGSEPEALYAKGLCYYYTSDEKKAVDYFHKVISVFPLHLGAIASLQKANKLIRLAKEEMEAFNAGDYEKAIALNNEALAIDASHKECNFKLHMYNAVAYTKLQKIQLAVEACTSALEIDENSVKALKRRALCYKQLGKLQDAVKDYEKVYKIDRTEENERLLNIARGTYRDKVWAVQSLVDDKKYQEALTLADEFLQVYNSADHDVIYAKGMCLYYMGQCEKALEHLQPLILIHPDLPPFKKMMLLKDTIQQGDKLFASGELGKARTKYRCAQNVDLKNLNLSVRMHCRIAETYLKENEVHDAIKEYTLALKIDEICVEALLGRAKCFAQHDDHKNAIEDYQRAYSVEKCEDRKRLVLDLIKTQKEKEAHLKKIMIAESLIVSGKTEDIERALNLAEECLQFDSSDINALCVKGSCLFYKNQYEQALNIFQQILLLKPLHPKALEETKKINFMRTMEKGDDLMQNGRWRDALHRFSEALKIAGQNKNLYVKLHCKKAKIYLELNDINSAIKEYTNALALDSNNVETVRGRALCFTKLNMYQDAINDFEKLCIIDKDEETKLWARNFIVTLKEKIAYKEKLEHAENLIASHQNEKLYLAQKLAEECLESNGSDTRALCVKGSCLYYKEQYEQALDLFKQVLLLDPTNSTALGESDRISYLIQIIEKGEDSFKNGRWQEALDKFNEASNFDKYLKPLNVRLHCKTAKIIKIMNEQNAHGAIWEYTKALVLDGNCVEALYGRAQCYVELLQYGDAMKDCEKLYTLDQSEEFKQLLQKVQTELQKKNNEIAVEKAEAGNKLYKRKKFLDALSMYKQAISLDPESAEYYSKSFSCYINLSMLKEAFADAKKAVALDAKCSKSCGGIAKCYLALGDLTGAKRAITKASDAGGDCTDEQRALETLQRLHAQAQKYIAEQSYKRAVDCMDQCLESSPFCARVKLIKVKCLVALGKVEQALEIAEDFLRLDKFDIEALYIKGLCVYYNEKHEQASKYFKEVLRLSPDHKEAISAYKKAKLIMQKTNQGNEELTKGRYQKALLLYNEALAADPLHVKVNAKLHFNKAIVFKKLNQTQLAADACTAAIDLAENYVKALSMRAECYTELEEYDCVIEDYEQLYKIDPSDVNKQLLDKAKRLHNKKSQCKNYYSILGLNRSATRSDIKRAYRQLSLVHHPDRHSGRSKFERKRHEHRFKDVLEACTVLSDPVNRRKYDARGSRTWQNDDDDDDDDE